MQRLVSGAEQVTPGQLLVMAPIQPLVFVREFARAGPILPNRRVGIDQPVGDGVADQRAITAPYWAPL